MSDDARIRIEDADGVRRVTLARPAKKNAFDIAQAEALWTAVEDASSDDAVRVLVVAAEGDYFSAGADVNLFLDIKNLEPSALGKVGRLFEPLRACPKPTVAMVQGHCVGMGVTILPHFDFVYAADHVTFTTPFVRLGLVLEYGSAWTLARQLGHSRAKELIFRGAPLDAATAERWGLCTRLFSADELDAQVTRIANEIAANPPGAVAECKRLIELGRVVDFDAAAAAEDAALASRYGSEENVQAVMALMQRKQARSAE